MPYYTTQTFSAAGYTQVVNGGDHTENTGDLMGLEA